MRQGRRHAAHCLCHQRCKAVVQLCIPAAPPASKYQSDYIKSNQMLTDKRAPAAYAKRRCKLGISINAEVLPQRPTFTQSCSACGSPALQRSRAVKRDECHIVTSSIGQAALLESSCCATRCMRQQASNPHGSQRTRCHYSRTSFTSQMQDMPLGKVTKSPAWRSWVGWQGE